MMFGEGKEYEDIWLLLQNSENRIKLKVLLRLLRYFGYDSRERRLETEQELDISEKLEKIIGEDM